MAKAVPVKARKTVTAFVDVRYSIDEYRLVKQILGRAPSDTVLNPTKYPTCLTIWRSMENL